MTFSLLRRAAGTRGLGAIYRGAASECFLLKVRFVAPIEPRSRAVLRPRTISGP